MFQRIDEKIKMLAKVICWVGIAASVISGFVLLLGNEASALLGIGTMLLGSLSAWAGSFVLYGFGELIEYNRIQTELALKADAEKAQ